MLNMLIVLEDTTIHAVAKDGGWDVTIGDNLTGNQELFRMDNTQLGAVLALSVGLGEDLHQTDKTLVDRLYVIAEPLFKESEIRPIP